MAQLCQRPQLHMTTKQHAQDQDHEICHLNEVSSNTCPFLLWQAKRFAVKKVRLTQSVEQISDVGHF